MSDRTNGSYSKDMRNGDIREPPTKRARISRSPDLDRSAATSAHTPSGQQPPASSLSAPTSSAQVVAESLQVASLSSSEEAASSGTKEPSSSSSDVPKPPFPEPDGLNPAPDDPPSSDFDDLDWGWLEKGAELEKNSSPSRAPSSVPGPSSKGKGKATLTPTNAAIPTTPARPVEIPKQVFFQTASHKKLAISETALREAQRRLEAWEAEEKEQRNDPKPAQLYAGSASSSSTDTDHGTDTNQFKAGTAALSRSLQRPGLQPDVKTPSFSTPRPARFKPPRPSLQHAATVETPMPAHVKRELIPMPSPTILSARVLRQPLTSIADPAQTSRSYGSSDATASELHTPSKEPKFDQIPGVRAPLSAGIRRGAAASTAAARTRGRFSTPFKRPRPDGAQLHPEIGSASSPSKSVVSSTSLLEPLSNPQERRIHALAAPITAIQTPPLPARAEERISVERKMPSIFDLTPLSKPRLGLRAAGFKPETTTMAYATSFGVPNEAFVILRHPDLSRHYVFETPKDIVTRGFLSPITALDALTDVVKKANAEACRAGDDGPSAMAAISEECLNLRWVQNHWGLVLWKLASYVRHKPEQVFELWSWHEVMRQLRYRYEREVNHAARSAVKRIQEHDASPSASMVLVLRGIMEGAPHWTQDTDDGSNFGSASRSGVGEHAQYTLELSDGWYRIRASVDKTLGRAIVRGRLKQGHKLAIRGARLHSAQDGTHVLDAMEKYGLSLTGNSTALARWDAPLGFSSINFCASVRSLTADGGCIACMDVVISKIHPRGYIDANNRESGQHQGLSNARSEAEELEAEAKWQTALEEARASVQADLEARAERWEEVKELVEEWWERLGSSSRDALDRGQVGEACERLLNELLTESNPRQALKLAVDQKPPLSHIIERLRDLIPERIQEERSDAAYEAQRRIQELCPPRRTRSFQVVRIRDAASSDTAPETTQDANAAPVSDKLSKCKRAAQLTVWDAAELAQGEGASDEDMSGATSIGGGLVQGGRYLVTQLQPMSRDRWRNAGADAEVDIYLCTRRNTTWRRIS